MNVLRASELAPRPWKNGAGTTRVIAQRPSAQAKQDRFGWYVAIADIDRNGPFSPYPGMTRHLVALEGQPISLHCRGASQGVELTHRIDAESAPFAFQGDWETDCTLLAAPPGKSDGYARVLNVIAQRDRVSVRIDVLELPGTTPVEKAAGETLVLVVANGSVNAMGAGANVQPALARHDAILVEDPRYASISLSPRGFAAARVIAIHIAPQG